MSPTRPSANTVDEYIAASPPAVQALLREVRRVVRAAAPEAEECLSYRIPAFKQAGVVVYFAAFKGHIGLYPPIRGDAALTAAVAPYAGPKGNLQFPYGKPLPLDPHRARHQGPRAAEPRQGRRQEDRWQEDRCREDRRQEDHCQEDHCQEDRSEHLRGPWSQASRQR